ncbi:MAG: PIG-L family deacetylase [Fimbriimonadaceae bacterium]|nr:PIG-L family deacetylase [Fimbriimonadaceae bacterium]
MRAFDPDPGLRWLFVFPHPDDELAIAAWLRRLHRAGASVEAVWLHSSPVREAESRAVWATIGGDARAATFLGAPTKGLLDRVADLTDRVRENVRRSRPDRVVTAAFEQGHLDHDATNLIANRAFDGPIFELPLYHTYLTPMPWIGRFADPTDEETLVLEPDERLLKKRLARGYPSQRIRWNLIWHEVRELSLGRRPTLASVERLRPQTHRDFRAPNLPGTLANRVARTRNWRRWVEALDGNPYA